MKLRAQTPFLLLVDDDILLMRRLAAFLQQQGYRTQTAENIDEACEYIDQNPPDLIVLDWNLPKRDGLGQLAKWRASGHTFPVLMLSGNVATHHRIAGLKGGADDYLTKPFDVYELIARIESLLRRTTPTLRPAVPVVTFGSYRFDRGSSTLTCNGNPVGLSAGELELMMVLCKHAGRVLKREQLLELISGYGSDRLDRSIDLRIARLRERIGDNARSPQWIVTVRGQGYRLDASLVWE